MEATSLSKSGVMLLNSETAVKVRAEVEAEAEKDAEMVEKVKLDANFL